VEVLCRTGKLYKYLEHLGAARWELDVDGSLFIEEDTYIEAIIEDGLLAQLIKLQDIGARGEILLAENESPAPFTKFKLTDKGVEEYEGSEVIFPSEPSWVHTQEED